MSQRVCALLHLTAEAIHHLLLNNQRDLTRTLINILKFASRSKIEGF